MTRLPLPRSRVGLQKIPAVAWSSLLGLLAVFLLFALVIGHDRDELVASSEGRADEQALVLADHAARLFEGAELALTAVIDDAQPLSWNAIQRSQPLWQRVRRLADRLPYVEGFWLYGPGGRLHLSSLAFPAPPLDASSRDFFIANSQGDSAGIHVSDIVRTSDDRATFRLSHRLSSTSGSFHGVASLTVDADFFRRFYDSLSLPEQSSVRLLRAHDLSVLVGGAVEDAGQLHAAIAAMPETGRFRATQDGPTRVVAYRRVTGFPLYVTVGIPQATLQQTLLIRIAWRAPMALGAALALAALTWLGFRQAHRQNQFQTLLEHKVAERTGELARANSQLETLIHEVHHRVNNNLQVIVSLLALQTASVTDTGGRLALRQCTGRVHTLSLVHQTLYGTGAMVELALRDYLDRLARDIGDIYGRDDVAVGVAGANPVLPLDTLVPLALIVHEALSNALTHAFPDHHTGKVEITLGCDDNGNWQLSITDNGIGLSADKRPEGLGLTLIHSLAGQIGATVAIDGKAGTRVTLCVPSNPTTLCT